MDTTALKAWIMAVQALSSTTTAAAFEGCLPENMPADGEAADVIVKIKTLPGMRPSQKAARNIFF